MRWVASVNLSVNPCELKWKMWRWAVSVLLMVHVALPQPLSGDSDSTRQSRQLDFGECCPCPDKNDESSFRNQGHWFSNNGRNMAELSENTRQFVDGKGFSRAGGFDDCPCRFRGADSEGSSSIFFPSAMRHTGSLSKSPDLKEDPKNLLEPEVGLASSVLETLREATDEEYRDALARDAARASSTDDATPEESAQNIVTIILPSAVNEDVIPELSHVQEPRCIHPLGSPWSSMRTPVVKPTNDITKLFKVPKSKHLGLLHRDNMDNTLRASNIRERVVDADGRNQKLTNLVLPKTDIDDVCDVDFKKGSSLKPLSILEREKTSPPHTNILMSLNNPKNLRSDEECNRSTDMKSAASDIKELFSDKPNQIFNSGTLTPENSPLNLKNILKLRDVELVPPGQFLEKLKLGQAALELPPLIENMPKLSDLLKNGLKFDLNKNGRWSNVKKNDDTSKEDVKSDTNIQVIPRDKIVTTDILDALPSTSNINDVKDNCDLEQKTSRIQSKPFLGVKTMKTEIIESIPNSFYSTKNNDKSVSRNDSDQEAKSSRDNYYELAGNKNDDTASVEMVSSPSEEDLSIPIMKSQDNIQSDGTGPDKQVENCLETIHGERESSENNNELGDINASNFDKKIVLSNNANTNNKESPLSKSMTSLRKSIFKKIEDRKKNSKLNKENKLRESLTESANVETLNLDCDTGPSQNAIAVLSNPLDTNSIMKNPKENTVQLEDLQKLSDSLLKKSLLKEKSATVIERTDCDKDTNTELSNLEYRVDTAPIHNEDLTIGSDTESNNLEPTELRNSLNFNVVHKDDKDLRNIDSRGGKVSTCEISTATEESSKFLRIGPDANEMTAEASEPVIGSTRHSHDPLQLFKNSRLGSPLFQDVIVQPSSLFEGIRNPSNIGLGEPLNLPMLDDIKERLVNVFGRNGKDSAIEDINCLNENPIMSAEPSTSNFRSKSPITPLENLNLDIFQLKPLSAGRSSPLSKSPALNLKSFRAKVPIPNDLDLKPLRLQSTMGNEGGLLGATLTLGRNDADTPKLFENFGNPLQNLPSLDEMMDRMRTNVESVIRNPLDISRNVDSIPRISDLSSSLRSDAENAIRALQERMGSTLGQANNLLSNSPIKQQELIERIADIKEDLDAKLKGLHYDLNDRLTSIHDNIRDQKELSSLNQLFHGSSLNSRNTFNNNNQHIGIKRLNMPTAKKLKLEGKKNTLGKATNYKNKPSIDRKINSVTSQRNFKMPASASVPIPKTINAPKLKSTLDKSLSSPDNDSKMRFVSSRMKPLGLENKLDALPKPSQEKSVFGKQAGSFREKKIKVTFGSTTPTPISTLKSKQRSHYDFDGLATEGIRRPDSELARRFGLKSRSEPNESPSEVQPMIMRSPMIPSGDCKDEMHSSEDLTDPDSFTNKNREKTVEESKTERNNPKLTALIDFARSGSNSRSTNKSPNMTLPSWPNVNDNSFLTKVRDAVKARLSSFEAAKNIGDSKSKTSPDMQRSASDNNGVIVDDNLKENVSYKCRMVCTKSGN